MNLKDLETPGSNFDSIALRKHSGTKIFIRILPQRYLVQNHKQTEITNPERRIPQSPNLELTSGVCDAEEQTRTQNALTTSDAAARSTPLIGDSTLPLKKLRRLSGPSPVSGPAEYQPVIKAVSTAATSSSLTNNVREITCTVLSPLEEFLSSGGKPPLLKATNLRKRNWDDMEMPVLSPYSDINSVDSRIEESPYSPISEGLMPPESSVNQSLQDHEPLTETVTGEPKPPEFEQTSPTASQKLAVFRRIKRSQGAAIFLESVIQPKRGSGRPRLVPRYKNTSEKFSNLRKS